MTARLLDRAPRGRRALVAWALLGLVALGAAGFLLLRGGGAGGLVDDSIRADATWKVAPVVSEDHAFTLRVGGETNGRLISRAVLLDARTERACPAEPHPASSRRAVTERPDPEADLGRAIAHREGLWAARSGRARVCGWLLAAADDGSDGPVVARVDRLVAVRSARARLDATARSRVRAYARFRIRLDSETAGPIREVRVTAIRVDQPAAGTYPSPEPAATTPGGTTPGMTPSGTTPAGTPDASEAPATGTQPGATIAPPGAPAGQAPDTSPGSVEGTTAPAGTTGTTPVSAPTPTQACRALRGPEAKGVRVPVVSDVSVPAGPSERRIGIRFPYHAVGTYRLCMQVIEPGDENPEAVDVRTIEVTQSRQCSDAKAILAERRADLRTIRSSIGRFEADVSRRRRSGGGESLLDAESRLQRYRRGVALMQQAVNRIRKDSEEYCPDL